MLAVPGWWGYAEVESVGHFEKLDDSPGTYLMRKGQLGFGFSGPMTNRSKASPAGSTAAHQASGLAASHPKAIMARSLAGYATSLYTDQFPEMACSPLWSGGGEDEWVGGFRSGVLQY